MPLPCCPNILISRSVVLLASALAIAIQAVSRMWLPLSPRLSSVEFTASASASSSASASLMPHSSRLRSVRVVLVASAAARRLVNSESDSEQ